MTSDLTWQDLQILLSTCCSVEEKKNQRIIGDMRGHTDNVAPRNEDHNIYPTGGDAMPDRDPHWNYQRGIQDIECKNHMIT